MAYPPAPQYPQQPLPPPGPKTRPGTVTAAMLVQVLTAVVLVAVAIGLISAQGAITDVMVDLLETDPEWQAQGYTEADIASGVVAFLVILALPFLLFAIGSAVLGPLVYAGKRAARVLSWILAGLGLVCCAPYSLVIQLIFAGDADTTGLTDAEAEIAERFLDATPAWFDVLLWTALAVLVLGSLLVTVLLAMPVSNEFFRKPHAPLGPYQAPGYGQPPYGQPPQPGQPPQGPQPPSPPAQ